MSDNPPESTPYPPTRDEIVRDISKTISERRKSRNLTLEKVFQAIKIRVPYLTAIEEGRWDQLPADVFIRSFIKRYADYLGLDGEKLLRPYFDLNKPEIKAPPYPQILRGGDISRLQLIIMALLGIIVIILVKVVSQERSVVIVTPPAPAVVAETSSATVVSPIQVEPPKQEEAHKIEVFSPNSLWLRVSASNKTFEGFIPQDSTWTWRGNGPFSVRLGHTQEITMIFDGQRIPISEEQNKLELPLPR